MQWFKKFLTSTIGMKILMALTGLVLFGFVLVHMVGNYQIFLGEEVYNEYAQMLQGTPEVLWTARVVLLLSVVAHFVSAFILTMRSKSARPQGYKEHRWLAGTYAVRTMRFGGLVLLAFIGFHLAQFTIAGVAVENFEHCAWVGEQFKCQAFDNFISGFSNPVVVAFYIVAQAFLGLHLAHGVWSGLRTLGMQNPKFDKPVRSLATLFGTAVFLGNSFLPIAVLVGLIHR